jgi:hypothetical protein
MERQMTSGTDVGAVKIEVRPQVLNSLYSGLFLLFILSSLALLAGGVVFVKNLVFLAYACAVLVFPVAAFYLASYRFSFDDFHVTMKGGFFQKSTAAYSEIGVLEIVRFPFGSYSFRILSKDKKELINHLGAATGGVSSFGRKGIGDIRDILASRVPGLQVAEKKHWSYKYHVMLFVAIVVLLPGAVTNAYLLKHQGAAISPSPLPSTFAPGENGGLQSITNRSIHYELPSHYKMAGRFAEGVEYTDQKSNAKFKVNTEVRIKSSMGSRVVFFGKTPENAIEQESAWRNFGVITLLIRKRLIRNYGKYYLFQNGPNSGIILADKAENKSTIFAIVWTPDGPTFMISVDDFEEGFDAFPLLYTVTKSISLQTSPAESAARQGGF